MTKIFQSIIMILDAIIIRITRLVIAQKVML